ncbi:MAG TPA: hypothetical protein VGJ04_01810 [Pirellulales bacterium]
MAIKQGDAVAAHRWFDTSERWIADLVAGNVEPKQIRIEAAEVLNLKLEPPPQLSKTSVRAPFGRVNLGTLIAPPLAISSENCEPRIIASVRAQDEPTCVIMIGG